MDLPPNPAVSQSILRHKPFALFLCARVSTSLAFQMLGVAVGWHIYALTGSAMDLGLVGLVQFLPMFFLTLVTGHVADRYNRRIVARLCLAIEAVAIGVLAIGSSSGWLSERSIFAALFVVGAAHAFEWPTMQSLMPTLVPIALIPRAAAWGASSFQTATILGPAIGGLLYAAGPATVYFTAAVLFFAASIFTSLIKSEHVPAKHELVTLQSLFAGISFIRGRPAILGAISLDLFAVLFGGATALLPIYARDILSTGPWGLGLLRSAPAVGALAMSILLARHPLRRRVGRIMFGAVTIFGVATIVFAISTSFVLSLCTMVVLGAADVISVVIRHSLIQIKTPDEMRGRVSAVNSMFIGTSNQLGEFESGVTAAWFGVVPSVVIGGIGTLIIIAIWTRLFPQLTNTDSLEQS